MRMDAHTHIFPPGVVQRRERFFQGEAVFQLLYGSPKARLSTAEALLQAMDRDGVDCALVFGFPWQSTEMAARHNDYVLEAAARYAPRLVPMGCVHPLAAGAAREAERCLKAGARGLGELAVYEDCAVEVGLERFRELIDCCKASDGILLVHANEPVGHLYPGKAPLGLAFYYALARVAAGVPLILAHWGGGLCFFELLKRDAPEVLADVYYDTAASPFLYRPAIYRHMANALVGGKILFGSDYPLLPPGRYFEEMAAAGLSQEEMGAICGGNAESLFFKA